MSTSAKPMPKTGRVPRLFVETRLAGDWIALSAKQAHYLRQVLRFRAGRTVVVFDGRGNELVAVIETLTRDGAQLRVVETGAPMPEPRLTLTLLQGIAKSEAMDLIVQKTTELGVHTIVPVVTEYSVVNLEAERVRRRLEHWRRVAHSACEQSGRHAPPVIVEPRSLELALGELPQTGTRIALDPTADVGLERGAGVAPEAAAVRVLIGPEGGLSGRELLLAEGARFERVSLGPRVLRAETAAMAACALAQAYWGDLNGAGSTA